MTLAIEPMNRWESFFISTAAEGIALCKAVANVRVGLLLDTVHMNIEEKSQARAIRTAGQWLRHLHVAENDRGTPGTGHTNWLALFQALRDVSFDRWCTIESFAWYKPEIAGSTHCWRDLAGSADELGRQGLAFLRTTAAAIDGQQSGVGATRTTSDAPPNDRKLRPSSPALGKNRDRVE
jgi:D-psicose/D-tagatose/L-ribulose 3-epimerase